MDNHERYSFRKDYLTKIKNKLTINKQNQIITTNTTSDKSIVTNSKVKSRIFKRK